VRSNQYPLGPGATAEPLVITPLQKAVPAIGPGAQALNFDSRPGDYDNGPGALEDGPYVNMPDWSNGRAEAAALSANTAGGFFQRGGTFAEEDGITFSPLRQLGSAIGFGSLPTGIYGAGPDFETPDMPRQWQTLLFCPHPPSRTTAASNVPEYDPTNANKRDHFGFATPRDHLWAEFFFMPAVEPAGVTDNWATEGKVNMNYQIMPFSWIKRRTAMHGALEGVRMTAIPTTSLTSDTTSHYKHIEASGSGRTGSNLDFQYAVNIPATLQQFDQKFDRDGQVFITPSEICDVFLVPQQLPGRNYGGAPSPPTAASGMMEWWEGNQGDADDAFEATGDNTREAPYAQLHPRLSTRSNVFKVHYRVQALQKAASTAPNRWDESKDRVTAEYRGESVVERYLDPDRVDITDFATNPSSGQTLDEYYDYRIMGRKQFAP
jgi:uncharacterized protein (TIGR02600 family)